MRHRILTFLTAVLMLTAIIPAVFAADYTPIYPGFPGIEESKAYKKFSMRPDSNLSRILYLIDRFGESNIQIVYDNQSYPAPFATTVARWFLARNYKKQTPEEWIKQWCSRSVISNKLIYVKLPDGKFLVAKDILETEIAALYELAGPLPDKRIGAKVADAPLAKSNGSSFVQNLPAPKSKLS